MKLSENIRIHTLHLLIQNLERSIAFYTNVIGLKVLSHDEQSISLGVDKTPLLVLHENPEAHQVRGTSGLYHFAILVPERKYLSLALQRIAETQTPVQGFAHHGVSEAIYLPDPDGNGIEIYRDLPRDEWPRDASGELAMVTDPLDVNGLLAAVDASVAEDKFMPPATTIGHMHLHVRDVDEAITFYRDALGFNLIQRYGASAGFLAAGDYHHHLGVNTWAGVGAPPKPVDAVGLQEFTVRLPDKSEFNLLLEHLKKQNITFNDTGETIVISDPSGNTLRFSAN